VTWGAATAGETFDALRGHLLRADGQEDICFASWYPSKSDRGTTALIADPILPNQGERIVHGNASFSSSYFLRAAREASAAGGGVVLLHSHPGGRGWQGMSGDDVAAEQGHAAQAEVLTDLPLVGITMAGDGAMSGRVWQRAGRKNWHHSSLATIRVAGSELRFTFQPSLRPAPPSTTRQIRTVSAWGRASQANLARLRVGVIGAGSVGAIVAEILARTGIGELVLIDYDTVYEHNLDRLIHATDVDVHLHRAKVDALALRLANSATHPNFKVTPLQWSVVEPEGFAAAAGCDVLFSCVDRPWPRHALNLLAYAHLVPVVDGGIAVVATAAGLRRADWRAHLVAPGRRCLHCLGQYQVSDVSLERDGYLDDPTYIAGLPDDHIGRRSENVMPFSASAASMEVLQLLSAVVAPSGVADTGALMYHFVGGILDRDTRGCEPDCVFDGQLRSRGDRSGSVPTGEHAAAKHERANRATARTRIVRARDRLTRSVSRFG
jgi:molybdopterin-synthase adenylyltransferase